MKTVSLHDTGTRIEVRIEKKVVCQFPYEQPKDRAYQMRNADDYVKKAINLGGQYKLKAGMEIIK